MIDYESVIPQKIRDIQPSGIRKFFDIAQQVEGVISLSIGEPDFKTPWAIRKEAINILERGNHLHRKPRSCGALRGYIGLSQNHHTYGVFPVKGDNRDCGRLRGD